MKRRFLLVAMAVAVLLGLVAYESSIRRMPLFSPSAVGDKSGHVDETRMKKLTEGARTLELRR